MNDPRVLMTTYPTAFLHRGGGEIEFTDIQHNLRMLGLRVDAYGPQCLPLSHYDVVLHYSVVPSGIDLIQQVHAAGKRIVLMPSLWLRESLSDQRRSQLAQFLSLADAIVFRSQSEYKNVSAQLPVDVDRVSYCTWGVDPCFSEPVDPTLFARTHGLQDYVLCMGIIEPVKNQLAAIEALRDLTVPLVFVGDWRDPDYYQQCRSAAPPHFRFVEHLAPKSEMLRSAIRGARLLLELSLEPPGFSALEAGMAGTPMVLSDGPWSREHFGDLLGYADPQSPQCIRDVVDEALQRGPVPALDTHIRSRHSLPQCLEPLARLLRQ